ncbi:hypothetical protein EUX98_g5835 [Antrodiella citrinella]|uniref:DUF221-domain-containing protein n=1 Tax=Antrodiella citrinella TaxID=2447956 RepID=A0A4V6S1T7_9APHY|nr:hypothetical protein EUX98_g5835 [Antrodiella citrinella]
MDLPNPIIDYALSDLEQIERPSLASEPRKAICIIGAGPSGLGALKVLLDHPLYKTGAWHVVVYEARESVGGVWLPADSASIPDRQRPPATPLYDALTTNLPHPVMAYPSLPFPPSTPLYPPASTVLRYLETYAETFDLTQHIRFRHRVVRTSWQSDGHKWRVEVKGEDAEAQAEDFDLLVVANGHYGLPRYLAAPGLSAWLDSGKATHSMYYQNPSHPSILETVDTILVVGGGPSGLDISSELRTSAHKNIVHSVTGATNEDLDDGGVKRRGRVKAFLDPVRGEVEFEDGTKESGIGHCVFATGYQDHFPFLTPPDVQNGFAPSIPPLPVDLYNSSYNVFPLAKHIFPLVKTYPPSSLVFLGLPFRVIPFPLVEAQMRAVLRVFATPESLDPTREAVDIVSRYEDIRARLHSSAPLAIAKVWHMLEEEHQFNYRDDLHAFAGPPYDGELWKVPSWVKEFYPEKVILRQEWRRLEKSGEAEDWVRGVGEGGIQEWIDLMRLLVKRAKDREGNAVNETPETQRTRLVAAMSNSTTPGIDNAQSASTSTFTTALVTNAIIFGAEMAAFTILRPYFPAIYQPRTYIVPKEKRVQSLSSKIYGWPLAIFQADYEGIKDANGLDAYFFVNFLRMIARILLPIWLISWLILLPLTSANTSVANHTGLDRFIFGNVAPDKQNRYWAHLILTWLFTIWIFWNIKTEMRHFIHVRQRWLIDPVNARSAQANTVLITGVPQRYLTEAALTKIFSHLPGGVRKVWLNRDLKDMPDLYDRRVAACNTLESAETSLLSTALKRHNKRLKKEAKVASKSRIDAPRTSNNDGRPLTAPSVVDAEQGDASLSGKLVPKNKRPSHRLPLFSWMPFALPLIGKQVDSIDWAREEIETTSAELKARRKTLARDVMHSSKAVAVESSTDSLKPDPTQTYPALNSAFILFNRQIAAQMAAQVLTHHEPYRMARKYTNVAPEDIIWANLNMNPYEARVRTAISWGITIGLIIVWAFPVAFVGIVSNIHSLCSTYHWLAWICKLPNIVVGILSGLLPPVALALLMMVLPIVLRLLARLEGIPQRTGVELSLMSRFFLFQILNSFLIVTLSSGIIAALPGLVNNPGNIPSLLAAQLPKASNFFLTYIILQGLSGTAAGFLTAIPLLLYYVKLILLGGTPRSVYNIRYTGRKVAWGTLFPSTTLLVAITLAYSIISPIINGLACATFIGFFFLWKYLFLWQFDQPRSSDTGGLFFPMAIQHIFVGLYLQQICLAALFFLARNESGKPSSVGEGALMIVLVAVTAFFHIILNNSYDPLLDALPLSLADKTFSAEDAGQDVNRDRAEQELDDQASAAGSDDAGYEKAQAKRRETSDQRPSPIPSISYPPKDQGQARAEEEQQDGSNYVNEASASPKANSTALSVPPEARRRMSRRSSNSSVQAIDEQAGPKEFYHPASVDAQRTIWIPQDPLGLGEDEEKANRERGIDTSTKGAVMDGKGKVDINEGPPEAGFEF